MKNFTNNFKQFTSRLSARWLIMALMLLVGTSSAWAAKVYFLNNKSWTDIKIYYWGGNAGSIGWGDSKLMTSTGDKINGYDVYSYDFGDKAPDNIIFRGSGKQTVDITYSANTCWQLGTESGGKYPVSVVSYTPSQSATFSFSLPNELYVGIPATITYELSPNAAGTVSFSCTTNNATIDGTQITANSTGTVTVEATIDYNTGYTGTTNTSKSTTAYIPEGVKLYLKPTGWTGDGAKFSAYLFTGTTTNTWAIASSVCNDSDVYEIIIPSGKWTNLIWCRMNPSGSQDDWSGSWGQTVDLTYEGKNLYTINNAYGCGDNKSCGVWGTYTPPSCCTTVNAPSVTSNGPICAGSTATLTLKNRQEGVTYKLNSTSGTAIFGSSTTYTTPALNANTTYKIYASHDDACTNDVEGSVTVTVNAEPKIILTQETETICKGESITLANYIDSKTGTVTWYTDQAMTKTAAATVSPTANATYYAKAVNSPCAAATAQLAVTVNDKPAVPTLSADNTSLVAPNKATLTVGNTVSGLTYTIYNGNAPGESQTSTSSDLTFEAGEAGSYTVKVTNGCGTSTSTPAVEITVCTPQTNEFRHANSNYAQLQDQPTYYPGDKAYFVSTITCCLTGTWSNNLDKGVEAWYTDLTGGTPRFYMTLTRAGNFTITNMATNGCTQDKNVLVNLDFTITALSEVTNANGTASGADIALTWNNSANHSSVMVVRYPSSGTETIPAGGQAYTAGNTLGGGTVVYVGTAESYTDKNLPAGASYKYYFYTVNNNYYSEGVVLNMSSCPTPAKPSLSSTAITACNGECTAQGYITINNMNDYKDDTYTFELGSSVVTPDANGSLGINSTAYTQYTVTVTNSCGNSNSAEVEIAINNITPTISGATFTQPGKENAIELTVPTGNDTKWTVNKNGDLSVATGSSTMFSAENKDTYTITADYNGCTDTHDVTVSDAFYVYMRQPKKGETAYNNFYHPNENPTQGGDLFYKEYASIPPAEGYTDYNTGGVAHDIIFTDCDGYVWYGFKASDKLVDGTNYFTVRAPNEGGNGGYYTHTYLTKPGAMISDIYYTMNENASGSSQGWYITEVSAPYPGPKVHASGDAKFNANNFADFVSLYVTDCSGNEVTGYQWSYTAPTCTYIGKETVTMSASTSNNIRVREAGNYTCTVTYEGGTTATSPALTVSTGATNTPALAEFSSNLPIIMVNTNGVGFPDCTDLSGQTASKNASTFKEKRSVDVKIYEGGALVYDRKARMNYRGSSSLNFVKKSYAFCPGDANCEEKDGKADYVKTAKLNMLGLGEAYDKDWVLYAAAADPSLMRNRLVFDSYAAMTGEWGVNSRYVELIVDGEYKGVYVFMDKITMNKNRVKVDEDKGFIVKFDKTDKEDRVGGYNGILGDEKTFKTSYTGKDDIGTYDTSIDQRFEIEYPEKDDYTTGWKARVDGIQGMFQAFEDALKQGDYATVQKYIDYTSWADWFIINEFTKNVDAYRASCIFVYTGEAGAKIEARPLWDQELSFNNQASKGTSDKGCDSTTGLLIQHSNVYSDDFGAPFWFTGGSSDITGGLLSDPCFVQVVKERWNMHQSGALSQKSLEDLVDEYADDLAPEGTTENAQTRETAFWDGKSRGTCDCSYNTSNATATGYQNKTFAESKSTITNWIADGAGGRREGLTTAINGLTGASFSIQIIPSEAYTTPWEPVEMTVSVTPDGYDYKLEYTDNDLGSVANTIIEEEGDKITYRIPRPWPAGDEQQEGERTDIEYGIKATLNVQDGTTVCGSQAAPSSTAKIILQDEPNDKCE